ncbi:hypothetical protein H6F47_12320 [Sphaerospermopsis sp. FACHB-1094]|uniref:hypothetical protein n=1 Tax=Sphaerospermopsis sp. FACHB-1094 TaxID=2692861 RepID=UPI0016837703|nr:hypothetical protein [Sphaerospermopsis sp. FACHB-1094]MBD2133195.1 hypothetical protein [Sphaerospermopsis sp. FACHB-1094]
MIIIPDFDIEIPFKGTRNYLHSSDVYNALCNGIMEFTGITDFHLMSKTKLVFRDFAQHPLRAVFQSHHTSAKAVFSFEINDVKYRCELIEREAEVQNRIVFNEEAIITECVFDLDHKTVAFASIPDFPYSPIEIVVAANKSLHMQYFSQNPGKWLFTEIFTEKPLKDIYFDTMKIMLKTCLSTRLTKSAIILDNTECGYICFSLRPSNS